MGFKTRVRWGQIGDPVGVWFSWEYIIKSKMGGGLSIKGTKYLGPSVTVIL